jgi:hypothetical protein
MRKPVKKVIVNKEPRLVRKPMMKKGGTTKKLKRYQDEGEVMMGPSVPSSPSSSTNASAKTFADYYKANLAAGLSEGKARKVAMVEAGVKEPKRRLDPNALINAVGNTAGAVGNVVNAVRSPSSSTMSPGPGPFKKGGATKTKTKAAAKSKMAKGGSLKAVPAGKTGLSKLPTAVRNKMGYQKKGGVTRAKRK